MIKRLTKLAILLLVGLAILSLLPTPAHAATFNITTSPLPILLDVKPGQSVSTKIRVQNSGTQPTNLRVDLKKFKASGDSGKPVLLDPSPSDDYFSWVHFDKTSFKADPGVWNEVAMTINTPASAAFGYYYGVVFSSTDPLPQQSAPGSAVKGGTAVLVLLNAQAAGEKRELSIASFNADKKFYEYLPATFKTTVKNTGNIHSSPSGTIFITKGKKTIATLDVNPGNGNILPDSERTFNTLWDDGFPVFQPKLDHGQLVSDKNSKPVQQLKWDFTKANHLRFGHYTAHLVMTYDDGTRDVPMEASVSFWVVPWKILPFIILAVVLIGIGLWTTFKNIYLKSKGKLRK